MWLWYVGSALTPEPIGVYDHPPPDDVGEAIGAVRLADADSVFAGAGPLARDATRVRDAFRRFTSSLIPGL